MEVLKTFVRLGKRYRPGDDPPDDLDAPTLAHYQRHGMLGTPGTAAAQGQAPAQRTPAPRQQRTPAPRERKPAAPPPAAPTGPAVTTAAVPANPLPPGSVDAAGLPTGNEGDNAAQPASEGAGSGVKESGGAPAADDAGSTDGPTDAPAGGE